MPDQKYSSISVKTSDVSKDDNAERYLNETDFSMHQRLAMEVLTSPTNALPAPKKRNMFHAMFLRAMDKRAAKERGTPEEHTAASLNFAATALHADTERATWVVNDLLKRARATPRPATPPNRGPLFQRPQNAPLSAYELTIDAYNKVVGKYEDQLAKCRWLQQRVAKFDQGVAVLKVEFVPAKKMGKMEHEVEGLENAGRKLVLESAKLGKVLEEVRKRAVA